MATKRFFGTDGVLVEIELPEGNAPFGATVGDTSIHALLNPLGIDPDTLVVDAAAVPDLKPTAGALPITKFPEPIPGSGEGAGVGQPSGVTLRDVWNNNPNRVVDQVETVQSGEIGSGAATGPRTEARNADLAAGETRPGVQASADSAATAPDFGDREAFPNKEALSTYITENGGEAPHAAATREELETAAREAYDAKQLA